MSDRRTERKTDKLTRMSENVTLAAYIMLGISLIIVAVSFMTGVWPSTAIIYIIVVSIGFALLGLSMFLEIKSDKIKRKAMK